MSPVTSSQPGGRRIASFLSWQGVSMLVQALTQIGVTAFLARFLSPLEFGLVAAANILVTFIQILSEGGLGASIVQRSNLSQSFVATALAVSLLISGAFYAVIVLAALPFQAYFGMEGLAAVVVVLGLGSFLAGAASIVEGVLQRELRFAALARITLFASIGGYAIPALGLALLGAGVWALVLATLGGALARLVLLLGAHGGRIWPRWDRGEVRDIVRFGFGLTQDRFWNWLIAQSGAVVIGTLFGQAQLGQFYMGSRLAILPTQYLSSIVSTVYFPLLSRSQSDSRAVGQQFIWLLAGVFMAITALGLFLALNAELVVRIAFGAGWDEAVVVFQVLCLGAGVRAAIQVCDALNIARGDVYALANRRAVAAIAMVCAIYLAQEQGMAGAAWATNIGYAVMLVLTATLANAGLQMSLKDLRPVLMALVPGLLLVGVADAIAVYGKTLGWLDGLSLLIFLSLANLIVAIPVGMLLSTRFRALVQRRVGLGAAARGG